MEFGCLGFFLFACTVVAVVMATVAGRRATTAREEIASLRATIDMLGRRLTELRLEMEKGRGATAAAPAAPPEPSPKAAAQPIPHVAPPPKAVPAPQPI